MRNCHSLPIAYKFQSALFIQYLQRNAKCGILTRNSYQFLPLDPAGSTAPDPNISTHSTSLYTKLMVLALWTTFVQVVLGLLLSLITCTFEASVHIVSPSQSSTFLSCYLYHNIVMLYHRNNQQFSSMLSYTCHLCTHRSVHSFKYNLIECVCCLQVEQPEVHMSTECCHITQYFHRIKLLRPHVSYTLSLLCSNVSVSASSNGSSRNILIDTL